MHGWQCHDIGFESQTKKINGINIWKYPWNDMDEPSFEVPHPQYPDQRHKITPYFIKTKGKTLTFAAGEVSNCVWCIYVAELITSQGVQTDKKQLAGSAPLHILANYNLPLNRALGASVSEIIHYGSQF